MSKECKTMIESFCGSEKIKTPFVEGQGIDISYNEEKEVVISSTGGGTADINQGTGIEIDNQTNTVSFDMPPWIVQDYENMGVTYLNGVAVFNGDIRFRYGTEPPFTFLEAGTSLPLPIVANNGIIVDVSEDGMSLEIHTERQQVTTTFSQGFTQINNLISQGKTIKFISFSPSATINANVNAYTITESGMSLSTGFWTFFNSGATYMLYPTDLDSINQFVFALSDEFGATKTIAFTASGNIRTSITTFSGNPTNLVVNSGSNFNDTAFNNESLVIEYE